MTGITYCKEVVPPVAEVFAKLGLAGAQPVSREAKSNESKANSDALSLVESKKNSVKFDYNTWIKDKQESRNKDWKLNVLGAATEDAHPPHEAFTCAYTGKPYVQLFSHDVVEQYAQKNTTIASKNIQQAARITDEKNMFSPCMVGSLESQFLKMQCMLLNCKRALDVGTFTGMSAIAMAEGCLLGTGVRKLLSDKFRENRSKPGADTPSKLAGEVLRENAPVV